MRYAASQSKGALCLRGAKNKKITGISRECREVGRGVEVPEKKSRGNEYKNSLKQTGRGEGELLTWGR